MSEKSYETQPIPGEIAEGTPENQTSPESEIKVGSHIEIRGRNGVRKRFVLVTELGSGYSGTVYAADDADPIDSPAVRYVERIAVKVSKLSNTANEQLSNAQIFLEEARILQALSGLHHPGLPQFYDVQKRGDEVLICMEYLDGPNLAEQKNTGVVFDEPTLRRLIARVGGAIAQMHRLNPMLRQH